MWMSQHDSANLCLFCLMRKIVRILVKMKTKFSEKREGNKNSAGKDNPLLQSGHTQNTNEHVRRRWRELHVQTPIANMCVSAYQS